MNLARKPPLGIKAPAAEPDPEYLRAVRGLPCCICEAWGMVQTSPTTAHHCIHDRHSTDKAPDRMAIPLCDGHHQGTFDTTKLALHRSPEAWRRMFGADHEWIAPTQDRIAGELS
jgi:hypothetical protein